MISGRTLAQGASCESKMSLDFYKAASYCSMSEDDLGSLALSKADNVLISSDFGRVVLQAHKDEGLPNGLVFIPMGPWANVLVGPDTGGCGTPQFKGVPVEVTGTKDRVLDVRELFLDLVRSRS